MFLAVELLEHRRVLTCKPVQNVRRVHRLMRTLLAEDDAQAVFVGRELVHVDETIPQGAEDYRHRGVDPVDASVEFAY